MFEHLAGEDIYSGKGSSCGVCIFSGSAANMEADDNSTMYDYVVFVRRLHTHPGNDGLPIWVLKCRGASQSKRRACAHFLAFDDAMWFGGFCQLCAWLRRFARYSLRERDSWFLSGSP